MEEKSQLAFVFLNLQTSASIDVDQSKFISVVYYWNLHIKNQTAKKDAPH